MMALKALSPSLRDHAHGSASRVPVPSRARFLRRSLLALVVGLSIGGAALAQTATDPNEGSRLTYNGLLGSYSFAWWGQPGRTYFLQHSGDLSAWEYLPLIESGNNGLLSWGFTSTASKFLLRLRYSDIPTSDPLTADFDGDKVSNWDELLHGTDPLLSLDTDANGLPDDWETFYFSHLGVDPNAKAPGGGMTNQQHFTLGSNPNNAPPPPTLTAGPATLDQSADTLLYPANETGLLLQNGNFSTPAIASNKTWDTYPGITGWTALSGTLIELQKINVNTTAGAGQYCELDAHWPTTDHSGAPDHGLQQTVNLARGHYLLFCDYRARQAGADSFTVKLQPTGSSTETLLLTKNAATTAWQRASVPFEVTGGNPNATTLPVTLLFDEVGPRNSYGPYIDNVILLPVDIAPDESMFEDSTTLALAAEEFGNGAGDGSIASDGLTSNSASGLGANTGTLPAGGGLGTIGVQSGVVRGDLIPSIKAGSSEKHFVSPKKTAEIPFDYVILRAKGILAEQIQPGSKQVLEWHINNSSYGQIDSSNPLKFNVKRDAAKHAIVSIGPKGGNTAIDSIKMNVWVVWTTTTPTLGNALFKQYPPAGARYEVDRSPTTGWRFKFKIEPSDICDPTVAERPDLTGGSRKNVPGYGKPYLTDPGLGYADTAAFKWDVSRQMQFTIRNPGSITKALLQSVGQPAAWYVNQPKAVDNPVLFPASDVEGNDDPPIADEDANPYQAKAGGNDGLDHQIGELSSVDAPATAVINSWGAAGRYFAVEENFREFSRVELWDGKRLKGQVWFRISDFSAWHHYLDTTFDGAAMEWRNTTSSSGTGHPKP